MTAEKPSQLYLKAVYFVCTLGRNVRNKNPDEGFGLYLERKFAEATKEVREFMKHSDPRDGVDAQHDGLFVFGVGLFALGQLDKVDVIIDNIPSGKGHVRRLAWSLKAMLPLPEGLDPLVNPEDVRRWIHEREGELEWNEEKGLYELI